jgi:hypothetical protein
MEEQSLMIAIKDAGEMFYVIRRDGFEENLEHFDVR